MIYLLRSVGGSSDGLVTLFCRWCYIFFVVLYVTLCHGQGSVIFVFMV